MNEHTELLIELMRKTIEQKDEQIQKLRETIENLEVTVASPTETIEEFRRKFFGSSSEKSCQRKPQTLEEDETKEVTVNSFKRYRKPKSTQDELYQNLPVKEIRCPMPEDGRLCPDCDTPMKTITWQYVREELSITPAKVERVRYPREVLVCCLAHCRRYFFEAIPAARRRKMKLLDISSEEEIPENAADPEKAIEKNKIPAEIGRCYCNQPFHTERKLKEMTAEEKKAERLKQEVPIWEKFFAWLETPKPLKGSRLEKAVNYAVNHRELLCNYLLDGRCEISNNRAEWCAKSYGTGRKNFLFHNTVNGAKSSAVIYSLVKTAKANKLNAFQYPYTLLLYTPDYKDKPTGVEAMMPWSDFIKERCSGVIDVNTETPENYRQIPLK